MTDLRKAAKQALRALKLSTPKTRGADDDYAEQGWKEHNATITALRTALEELPQEPVAASLKRGTTGRCTRKVCECEKEGLGLECIHLEPVVDGYPLWSGIPKAEPVQEFASIPGTNVRVRLPVQEPKPVAWRTFDGEGGYDYRDYDMNEDYDHQYIKRNGGRYAHWVEPLWTHPPQTKTNQCGETCERAQLCAGCLSQL